MTRYTCSRRRLRKRLLKPLALAFAGVALAVPATALGDSVPGSDDKVIVAVTTKIPASDDKVIVPGPSAALHPDRRAFRLGPYPVPGEHGELARKSDGLRPGQPVSEGNGISWEDAGIALAFMLALAVTTTAAALTIRRRRDQVVL